MSWNGVAAARPSAKTTVLTACEAIIKEESKYCLICFRTENDRTLRPSKSLQILLGHLSKELAWAWQAMPLEQVLLCYMCEARASSAARLVRAVSSAMLASRLLVHCRQYPADVQRLGQLFKGDPVSSPLACTVLSSDVALSATRRFTTLENTITQLLNTADPPPPAAPPAPQPYLTITPSNLPPFPPPARSSVGTLTPLNAAPTLPKTKGSIVWTARPKRSKLSPKTPAVARKRSGGTHKGSIMPPKGSDVPPKGSIMPPKGSEVSPKGSIMPPKRSEVSPKGSIMLPKGSEVSPKGSIMPPKRSEVSPKGSIMLPKGSDVPPKRSDVPPKRSDVPPKRSDVPRKGSAVPPQDPIDIERMPPPILEVDVKSEEPDIETFIIDDDDDVPTAHPVATQQQAPIPVPTSVVGGGPLLTEAARLSIAEALKAGLGHFVLPDVNGTSMLAISTGNNNLLLHQLLPGSDGCMYAPTVPARVRDNQLEYLNNENTLLLADTASSTVVPARIAQIEDVKEHFQEPVPSDDQTQTRSKKRVAPRGPRRVRKRKWLRDALRELRTSLDSDSDSDSDSEGTDSVPEPDGTSNVLIEGMSAQQAEVLWSSIPTARLKGDDIDWEDKIPDNLIAYADS